MHTFQEQNKSEHYNKCVVSLCWHIRVQVFFLHRGLCISIFITSYKILSTAIEIHYSHIFFGFYFWLITLWMIYEQTLSVKTFRIKIWMELYECGVCECDWSGDFMASLRKKHWENVHFPARSKGRCVRESRSPFSLSWRKFRWTERPRGPALGTASGKHSILSV